MPLLWPVLKVTTLFHFFDERKRTPQYVSLLFKIRGCTKVVTHRKVHEQTAWWFDLRSEVSSSRNTNGSNTGLFHFPADQTNGLVIERSGRCGGQDIHRVLIEFFDKSRDRLFNQFGPVVNPAHETTPEPRRKTTDRAVLNQFT